MAFVERVNSSNAYFGNRNNQNKNTFRPVLYLAGGQTGMFSIIMFLTLTLKSFCEMPLF